MTKTKSFRTCGNKGFQITLPNGITISTQFGGGNYSDNYSDKIEPNPTDKQANQVEFAAWDSNIPASSGNWVTRQLCKRINIPCDDDVLGRINISQWLRLLDTARKLKV